ncbi:hypothetical protein [Chromobacterium sp. IIBBL 290-4]|uniref:hypothetical protein n=1 Tax=Chromobacterium sp. IIBBL 290-4 TaxID=2953890 RepID=UPI0020B8DA16|nr:hypothetical protein [Chromobacterium sp. IIBBL 290-4]UTH74225.1 hypothetical protein NKT35_22240 [Chromobacterium sp. IIBBL 290-4]
MWAVMENHSELNEGNNLVADGAVDDLELPFELEVGREGFEKHGGNVVVAINSLPHEALNVILYFAYLNANQDVKSMIEYYGKEIDKRFQEHGDG